MGKDFLVGDNDSNVGIYVLPSCEAIAGTVLCNDWIAPKRRCIPSMLVLLCSVTPLTNITVLTLVYQLYLNRIFHRLSVSFYTHAVTMPLVDLFLLATAAEYKFNNTYGQWIDLSFVAVSFIFIWYCLWGVKSGIYWMGPCSIPILAACYVGSHYYQEYAAAVVHPMIWVTVFSLIQSWSHIVEDMPPRVAGTPYWTRKRDFFCREVTNCSEFIERVIRAILQSTIFGTLDELIASPRLLPLFWSIAPVHNMLKFFNIDCESRRLLDSYNEIFDKCLVSVPRHLAYVDDNGKTVTIPLPPIKLSWIGRILDHIAKNYFSCLCVEDDAETMLPNPALDAVGVGGGYFVRPHVNFWKVIFCWYCNSDNVKSDMFTLDMESALINQFPPLETDGGNNNIISS